MEDEIDLRQYIAALLRHWKLIVIITILAGAVVLVAGLLTPQAYEAKSRVYILKGDAPLLLSLAKSNSIADDVGKQAAVNFSSSDLTAGKILGAVQARQQGSTIEFTVLYSNPAKAAFIANQWAEQYVVYVDNFFRMTVQSPQEARSFADSVKKIYMEKQKALLASESASSINDLKLLIELLTFQDKTRLLAGSPSTAPAVKSLYYTYLTRALNGQDGVAATAVPATMIPAARIEDSDDKVSVAVINTLTGEVTEPGLRNALTLVLDQIQQVTAADIDNLISLWELRAGVSQAIPSVSVNSRIASLKSRLVEQTAQSVELTVQRDAALKAYQAALTKVSEADIAQAVSGGYVRVADRALVPDAPLTDNRRWLNIAIALVAGFIIGVIGAFGVEYFSKTGGKPDG